MAQASDVLGPAVPPQTSASEKRARAKMSLWLLLGIAALFVFVTSEVALLVDYRLYHDYRLQLIADRWLLVPHVLGGSVALLLGPLQFSSRVRQRNPKLHRVFGRVYVFGVLIAACLAIAMSWGRPLLPGTLTQGVPWMVCTTIAFVAARNGRFAQHRQWMVRSYAVTFTFITSRLLNPWPRYWNMSTVHFDLVLAMLMLASILAADIGLSWRELGPARRT